MKPHLTPVFFFSRGKNHHRIPKRRCLRDDCSTSLPVERTADPVPKSIFSQIELLAEPWAVEKPQDARLGGGSLGQWGVGLVVLGWKRRLLRCLYLQWWFPIFLILTNDIRRRHKTSWNSKGWRLRVLILFLHIKEVGSARSAVDLFIWESCFDVWKQSRFDRRITCHILINQQTYQCWILRNLFMFKDKRPNMNFFIRCSKFERSIVTRKITEQSHIRHRTDLRWTSEKGWQRGVSRAECFAWNPRSKMWFGGVAAL